MDIHPVWVLHQRVDAVGSVDCHGDGAMGSSSVSSLHLAVGERLGQLRPHRGIRRDEARVVHHRVAERSDHLEGLDVVEEVPRQGRGGGHEDVTLSPRLRSDGQVLALRVHDLPHVCGPDAEVHVVRCCADGVGAARHEVAQVLGAQAGGVAHVEQAVLGSDRWPGQEDAQRTEEKH